jgi:cadmium resistance protein CadD (predicted permease)
LLRSITRLVVDLVNLVVLGVSAFAATNIDDIFLLMLFFSSSNLAARHVVAGQYAGFGLLVGISAVGSLVSLVVPSKIIGLLGLVPIAIGVKKLFDIRKPPKGEGIRVQGLQTEKGRQSYLSVSRVATVTFADGSDNIGVYVPLFASHGTSVEITTLIAAFLVMTGVWCAMGHYVVNHRFLARQLREFGHLIFPFVLIVIGISVLAETLF